MRSAIIDVLPGTITLFATGCKEKEWFFYPEGHEPVHHSEYAAWRAERGLS